MSAGVDYREELRTWYLARQEVTYTDGTAVREGDRIRYHQAPGGLMAHGDWVYGVAVRLPVPHMGTWELVLRGDDDGRHYNLFGHVIEPVTVTGRGCSCARHTDGSVTTFLCPVHADHDPCLTMSQVTGRRRKGTIRRGVCSACGHGSARPS